MPKLIDMTGQRYGRLTVLQRAPNLPSGRTQWRCRCTCGGLVETTANNLRRGKTQSCGCLRLERLRESLMTHGQTLGGKQTRAYQTWSRMIQRCCNPSNPDFDNYGGRGITCDAAWRDFAVFIRDMGEPPAGYSIDRIDNSQGYHKGNCRWASRQEQANNKRNNRVLTVNGITDTVSNWARKIGISDSLLRSRLHRGWSPERALTPHLARPGAKSGNFS